MNIITCLRAKGESTLARILLLLISLSALLLGCASQAVPTISPAQHLLKGWGMYSWQESGDWNFVLFPLTNAVKTTQEIMASGDKVKGVENLKRELARMPRGEEVSWSTDGTPEFSVPPGEIVVDLAQFCGEHGIVLKVMLGR